MDIYFLLSVITQYVLLILAQIPASLAIESSVSRRLCPLTCVTIVKVVTCFGLGFTTPFLSVSTSLSCMFPAPVLKSALQGAQDPFSGEWFLKPRFGY